MIVKSSENVANFFWYGPGFSQYEEKCILSFVRNGFKTVLWTSENIKFTDEVQINDYREVISNITIDEIKDENGKTSIAAFSDLFRYKLLLQKGGWWFDVDCICLKRVDRFEKLKVKRPIIAGYESEFIASGVLNIPNKILAKKIYREALEILEKNNNTIKWGDIGPKLLTDIVKRVKVEKNILPTRIFYPVYYKDALDALDPENVSSIKKRAGKSLIYHYWGEIFRRNNINKFEAPPKNSFLHELLFSN